MNIAPRILFILLMTVGSVSLAQAKDGWMEVRSPNFVLIGNASAKDMKTVAERLEHFRSALDRLLNSGGSRSRVQTRVYVFRDEASYLPYKPLRADGTVDKTVQGYFQSGQEVNYITVTVGRTPGHTSAEAYHTIFHEYVHFVVGLLYPNAEVPTWFNEGLAEYYSTFASRGDHSAEIGLPISDHVRLLKENTLLPLDTLFPLRGTGINNSSVYSRILFYAESWAFVHYLIDSGKTAEMRNFIQDVLKGTPQEQAFRSAFGQSSREMEPGFRAYIQQKQFRTTTIDLEAFDAKPFEAKDLSDPAAQAYLGDLLYQIDRATQAEPMLIEALKVDPSLEIANTDLGMIRFDQKRFAEARKYLTAAAATGHSNPLALYRYAYLLSQDGFADPARLAAMRDLLHRAIAAGPALTESYDLLAETDLATNADLDEAANALQTALRYEPGRNDFAIRLAEVYLRQKKVDSAREIAERVSKYAAGDLKKRADAILGSLGTKSPNP
jgi:hypothetical protein